MMTRRTFNLIGTGALLSSVIGDVAADDKRPDDRWTYLDNGTIRLGVDRESGACIGYLALSARPTFNYLNHFDRGRFVQQSYYGDRDGSMWDKKPWMWNPVQGGDWRGKPARLLAFNADATTLRSRGVAMHWATGEEIPEVVLEQQVRLIDSIAHVTFRMRYTGTKRHAERHQELPAVFIDRSLPNLALYSGERPWTGDALSISRPGWPNESRTMTEPWAAYLDDKNAGVGVMVPGADKLTCYRFGDGTHASHCSYFAPIKTFAMEPGLEREYDVFLTIGTIDEMRTRFRRIDQQLREKSR